MAIKLDAQGRQVKRKVKVVTKYPSRKKNPGKRNPELFKRKGGLFIQPHRTKKVIKRKKRKLTPIEMMDLKHGT